LINIILNIFFVDDIGDKLCGPRNHGCVAEGESTTFERFTVESGRERGIKVCGNHVRSVSFEEDAKRRMGRRGGGRRSEEVSDNLGCGLIRCVRYDTCDVCQ